MTDGTPSLVQLTELDAERAGAGLAQAFATDPLYADVLPDDDARRRLFPWFFHEQRALWLPVWRSVRPCRWPRGRTPRYRRLAPTASCGCHREASCGGRIRGSVRSPGRGGVAAFPGRQRVHGRDPGAGCATAVPLPGPPRGASGPAGASLGGLLLQHYLAAADGVGLAACLGTSEPNTLGFYRRHGLTVVADEVEPDSGLGFWVLGRGLATPALT
jgi:hypothetical protein